MAKREFILQGFTTRTHADAVRELFAIPDIRRIVLSVAFVSEDGVRQIEKQLKAHSALVTVFAGIRNGITSHQGLMRLHKVIGSRLFIVDTGSRNVIFHPKVYLVCGKTRAGLVIGSANLTLGGLNNNIEAGMMLDFDVTDAADNAVIKGIEDQIGALPHDYPSHVVKVSTVGELNEMLAGGRLVDEMAVSAPRPTTLASGASGTADTVPRIKLKATALRRPLAMARVPQKAITASAKAANAVSPAPASATVGVEFELVWASKPLTRRDLTIPDTAGTHATGSVNLDKGLLAGDVDHRRYFRDVVFPFLGWTSRSRTVDEAYAKFQLVLKGISYGEFDLALRHTTSTTSEAYKQRNAMTRLSWGPVRKYVAQDNLIGRTLSLYRDKIDPTRFVLEID